MSVFIFSGDPNAPGTDPASCDIGGMTFQFCAEVEVADEAIAAKLRRHSHFTEVAGSAGYRAVHHGGGRFIVVSGDKQVLKGLTKADADAFNAMTDAEKTAYVQV